MVWIPFITTLLPVCPIARQMWMKKIQQCIVLCCMGAHGIQSNLCLETLLHLTPPVLRDHIQCIPRAVSLLVGSVLRPKADYCFRSCPSVSASVRNKHCSSSWMIAAALPATAAIVHVTAQLSMYTPQCCSPLLSMYMQ